MGRLRVFDDLFSFVHFLVALVLALLDPVSLVAVSIVFVVYQLVEVEKRPYKLGDFVEFMAGVVAGVVLRFILGLLGWSP